MSGGGTHFRPRIPAKSPRSPAILGLRNQIRAGKVTAPTIYTTGVFIQQPAFMTAEQVRREVISEKESGYDFIKVQGELSREAYDALFETARAQQIRVVGHVPSNLGIDAALGRQVLVVHAEEFFIFVFPVSSGLADRSRRN